MGFFKKAFKAVTKTVTQTAKTVGSLAQGDIKAAAQNAAGALVSANPLTMANTASGGVIADVSASVPIAGSPLSKSLQAGDKISSGNFTGSDLKQYAVNQGKLGALVIGGATFGATPTLLGAKLASGDAKGALGDAFSEYGSGLVPGEFKDLGDNLKGYANLLGASKKSGSGSPVGNFTPSVALDSPQGESNFMGIALLGLGAVVVYKLAKKGKK